MDSELCYLSAAELSDRIERRSVSPVEIVTALLDRIAQYNDTLHSYITVCAETALRDAREAEQEIAAGRRRGRCTGCRSPRRISSSRAASARRATRGHSSTSCRTRTRPSCVGSPTRA